MVTSDIVTLEKKKGLVGGKKEGIGRQKERVKFEEVERGKKRKEHE